MTHEYPIHKSAKPISATNTTYSTPPDTGTDIMFGLAPLSLDGVVAVGELWPGDIVDEVDPDKANYRQCR